MFCDIKAEISSATQRRDILVAARLSNGLELIRYIKCNVNPWELEIRGIQQRLEETNALIRRCDKAMPPQNIKIAQHLMRPEHFSGQTISFKVGVRTSPWNSSQFRRVLLMSLRSKLILKLCFFALRFNSVLRATARQASAAYRTRQREVMLQEVFNAIFLESLSYRYVVYSSELRVHRVVLKKFIQPVFSSLNRIRLIHQRNKRTVQQAALSARYRSLQNSYLRLRKYRGRLRAIRVSCLWLSAVVTARRQGRALAAWVLSYILVISTKRALKERLMTYGLGLCRSMKKPNSGEPEVDADCDGDSNFFVSGSLKESFLDLRSKLNLVFSLYSTFQLRLFVACRGVYALAVSPMGNVMSDVPRSLEFIASFLSQSIILAGCAQAIGGEVLNILHNFASSLSSITSEGMTEIIAVSNRRAQCENWHGFGFLRLTEVFVLSHDPRCIPGTLLRELRAAVAVSTSLNRTHARTGALKPQEHSFFSDSVLHITQESAICDRNDAKDSAVLHSLTPSAFSAVPSPALSSAAEYSVESQGLMLLERVAQFAIGDLETAAQSAPSMFQPLQSVDFDHAVRRLVAGAHRFMRRLRRTAHISRAFRLVRRAALALSSTLQLASSLPLPPLGADNVSSVTHIASIFKSQSKLKFKWELNKAFIAWRRVQDQVNGLISHYLSNWQRKSALKALSHFLHNAVGRFQVIKNAVETSTRVRLMAATLMEWKRVRSLRRLSLHVKATISRLIFHRWRENVSWLQEAKRFSAGNRLSALRYRISNWREKIRRRKLLYRVFELREWCWALRESQEVSDFRLLFYVVSAWATAAKQRVAARAVTAKTHKALVFRGLKLYSRHLKRWYQVVVLSRERSSLCDARRQQRFHRMKGLAFRAIRDGDINIHLSKRPGLFSLRRERDCSMSAKCFRAWRQLTIYWKTVKAVIRTKKEKYMLKEFFGLVKELCKFRRKVHAIEAGPLRKVGLSNLVDKFLCIDEYEEATAILWSAFLRRRSAFRAWQRLTVHQGRVNKLVKILLPMSARIELRWAFDRWPGKFQIQTAFNFRSKLRSRLPLMPSLSGKHRLLIQPLLRQIQVTSLRENDENMAIDAQKKEEELDRNELSLAQRIAKLLQRDFGYSYANSFEHWKKNLNNVAEAGIMDLCGEGREIAFWLLHVFKAWGMATKRAFWIRRAARVTKVIAEKRRKVCCLRIWMLAARKTSHRLVIWMQKNSPYISQLTCTAAIDYLKHQSEKLQEELRPDDKNRVQRPRRLL